jgi:uncharacterized membrane protein
MCKPLLTSGRTRVARGTSHASGSCISDRHHCGPARHDGARRRRLGRGSWLVRRVADATRLHGERLDALDFYAAGAVELVTDQLPSTPSRKVPMQFGARVIMGALAGATIGASGGVLVGGLIAGVLGAVVGTLGGAAARGRLAVLFGKDPPAAFIEDAVAIVGAMHDRGGGRHEDLRRHRYRRRPGRPFLAARMVEKGMTVALIERKFLGGTCVNAGCMPTKTLVASARAAHVARGAGDYGVTIPGEIGIDMRWSGPRRTVTMNARNGLIGWFDGMHGMTVDLWTCPLRRCPKTVTVNGERLTAPRFFLNVGARPTIPDMPGHYRYRLPHQHLDHPARYAA